MRKTISNLQIIVLSAVILTVLLLGVVFGFGVYDKQIAFADGNLRGTMSDNHGMADDLISPITEWVGIAAIGTTTGLVISIGTIFNNKSNNNYGSLIRNTILASIAVLSISVGIIHLLLVKEHMRESYIWGIVFLAMGIPQVIYGIIMTFGKKLSSLAKAVLYNIGIAGNTLFIGIFIYVRLFVPPFSPDGTPVNELQTNGVLTVLLQSILVALLIYLLRSNQLKGQLIPQQDMKKRN